MPNTALAPVAFLGLGHMGRPMAKRLLDAGHLVAVWNRTPARAAELVSAGARLAATPAGAARGASIVVLMLADPAAVERVLGGDGGIATVPLDGVVVVDCSTIGPDAARQAADRVRAAGGRYVDAPVLGSTPAAASGTLTVLAGGDDPSLAAATPVLERFGRVVRTGEVGSGNVLKLVMNLLVGGIGELLAEAIVLAERSGLTVQQVRETVLGSVLKSPFLEYKGRQLFERDFAPLFRVGLMLKDLDLILDQASKVGATLPATRAIRELYARTAAAGTERDFAAVLEAVEQS